MTTSDIKNLPLGKELWDDKIKGLHLRHLRSGRKVFYLYFRTRTGKERRPKLGELAVLGLPGARMSARKMLSDVAIGIDPVQEWHRTRAELTVDALYDEVRKKVWSKLKSRWPREAKNLYLKNIKPTFGSLKLSEVRRVSVRNWHADMHETPISANRSLEVLARLFRYAQDHELFRGSDIPTFGVEAFREKKRRVFATPEELRNIGTALKKRESSDPLGVAYLYALILSGCRPLDLEKEDVALVNHGAYGILSFRGKTFETTGEKDDVILPEFVLKVLSLTDHFTRTSRRYLFGRFPRKLWNEVRKEAGCPHLWARDFRRLFGVTGLSNGLNLDGIGELLNHKSAQTTKRYTALFDGKKREMAIQVAEQIEKMLGIKVASPLHHVGS